MTIYSCEYAWLPDGLAREVSFTVEDGRITAIGSGSGMRLDGVTLPGFANTHSHAFHRALRGRTHGDGGSFWTWRRQMYDVAAHLDPDRYLALARAVYAEMALSGVTCVGEFHYVHHDPDGRPYADPNAMGHALIQAAAEAGIRITLLDTCYLAGGIGRPLEAEQRRFSDGDADGWAARHGLLQPTEHARIGAAVHSVRGVPRAQIPTVVAAEGPLHVHLSEQPAENEQCQDAYGCTPTALLDDVGALGPDTTAVHATHLTHDDISRLGATRTTISLCPTTERDLADGIGPARALADAGCALSLGSDQNAVIDLIEEARALEMHERLRSGQRGRFAPGDLVAALTNHQSLGWPDAGRLEIGARADLVTIGLGSPRTAGAEPAQVLFAASAPDISTVIVDGRLIVQDGQHVLGDVGALLAAAIGGARP